MSDDCPQGAAPAPADTLTVLRSAGPRLAKRWLADGTIEGYEDARQVRVSSVPVRDIVTLSAALRALEDDPRACVVRGRYVGDEAARPLVEAELERDARRGKSAERPKRGYTLRRASLFEDAPRHVLIIDVDGYKPALWDPIEHPAEAIDEYVRECLPHEFVGASCHWQLSGSAGHARNAGVLKAHLAFWLREALTGDVLAAWVESIGRPFDPSCLRVVQPIYTASPVFDDGVADPVLAAAGARSGLLEGLLSDDVDLRPSPAVLVQASRRRATGSARDLVDPSGKAGLIGLFHRLFCVEDVIDRWLSEVFEWADGAASGEGWRLTWLRSASGAAEGAVVCADRMHVYNSHASDPLGGRAANLWDLVRVHLFGELDDAWAVEQGWDESERQAQQQLLGPGEWPSQRAMVAMVEALPEVRDERRRENEIAIRQAIEAGRGSIPEAQHLTTDQANAGRILAAFGRRLIVVADAWFSWSGLRWERDEGEVYRCACLLSRMIHEEAEQWRAKPAANDSQREKHEAIAVALVKWAAASEMRSKIEAALALAKKMLAVESDQLDRDPWLLNCRNGTIDLRTGALREHRAEDYITRLVPIDYDAAARCDLWKFVLRQITLEQDSVEAPLAAFMQRWFGYCATGSTREQQFLVHYGAGSNGKSTVLDTIAGVLNDYAATAAPGLMVSAGKDRHPTEIADLMGRRMVTAHESGEDGVLREDFVKQATGSDRLKARWMKGDFFEFAPTHKLQLATNHKPRIRGQDVGIWRRVLLCPYVARFGTEQEVREGKADFVKDLTTQQQLRDEFPGVLAWIVEGARQWYADGLQPPATVLEATRQYQVDQDRVRQFVAECCDLGEENRVLIGGELGLYAAYKRWCSDNGWQPKSRQWLLSELERFVPAMGRASTKQRLEDGKRATARYVTGIGLKPDL